MRGGAGALTPQQMCAKVAGGVCLVGTTRPAGLFPPKVKIPILTLNLKCRGRAPILIAIIDRQIFLLTCCLLQGRRQVCWVPVVYYRGVGSVMGTSCLLQGRTAGSVLVTSCLLQGRTVGSVLDTSCLLQGRRQCIRHQLCITGAYSRQCLGNQAKPCIPLVYTNGVRSAC